MDSEFWLGLIARLGAYKTFDLDEVLTSPESDPVGNKIGPCIVGTLSKPCRVFWSDNFDSKLAIGIRISQPLEDLTGLAGHLAAIAIERGIIPIIFSEIGICGLESFGFRVEDVSTAPGQTSTALQEQLNQFWKIDIVINARDVISYS